jgi:type IV pilus assembly protein PilO
MAAKSDLTEALAKRTPVEKAAILIGILVVLGFMYWQFFYSDMRTERDSLRSRSTQLLAEREKLQKQKDELPALEREYERLQKTIRDNLRALPTESELPAFFDHLQRRAGEAQVSIRKWDRGRETAVDAYYKVPVAIEITGTFHQILNYFALLAPEARRERVEGVDAPDIAERIVTIEELDLGDPRVRDNEIVMTAKFNASTFRQREAMPELPAIAPSKPEGAAQKGVDRLKNPGAEVPQ